MPKLITASFKQRKFVQEYLKHGSKKKAALAAYDVKPSIASSVGAATLKQPTTIAYMNRLLEKAGMTDEKIADSLKVLLDAALSPQSLKQSNPTHALKTLEFAAKLKDIMPAEKKKIEKKILNVNLKSMTLEELQNNLSKLVEEARDFNKMINKNENLSKLSK